MAGWRTFQNWCCPTPSAIERALDPNNCCGGPALSDVDACCAADANARQRDKTKRACPGRSRGGQNFARGPIRHRRDVRGAARQSASPRRRAVYSRRLPYSGMAFDRRAGGPFGGLGRGGLHADRAGACNADRSHRRPQDTDRGIGAERARHPAVWLVCIEPLVGGMLQRDCGRGLCRSLHARSQGADRPPCTGRFVPRDHAVHLELLVRRRFVLSGFPTCC